MLGCALALLTEEAGVETDGEFGDADGGMFGVVGTVSGVGASLDELTGIEASAGLVVPDAVELCASADAMGEKTNDAIKTPTNVFLVNVALRLRCNEEVFTNA